MQHLTYADRLLNEMVTVNETAGQVEVDDKLYRQFQEDLEALKLQLREQDLTARYKEELLLKQQEEENLSQTRPVPQKQQQQKLRREEKKTSKVGKHSDSVFIRKRIQSHLQHLKSKSSSVNVEENQGMQEGDEDELARREEQEQNQTVEDLTKITGDLKQRALIIRDSIRDDVQQLENRTGLVDSNVANVSAQNSNLKEHLSTSTWNLCSRIGMLLFVVTMFMLMIVVIRLFPARW